ncbi:unnamed protein product [Hapterophycus canaliculatus]
MARGVSRGEGAVRDGRGGLRTRGFGSELGHEARVPRGYGQPLPPGRDAQARVSERSQPPAPKDGPAAAAAAARTTRGRGGL